jgi:hypothetical protein
LPGCCKNSACPLKRKVEPEPFSPPPPMKTTAATTKPKPPGSTGRSMNSPATSTVSPPKKGRSSPAAPSSLLKYSQTRCHPERSARGPAGGAESKDPVAREGGILAKADFRLLGEPSVLRGILRLRAAPPLPTATLRSG